MAATIGSVLLSSKIDTGKYVQVQGAIGNGMYVCPQTHDVYGRENLCQNSLFSLYPGKADCVFQGLLETETNMRPAYWRYVGDCNGTDDGFVGGNRQMVLGYPGTGYVYDAEKEALEDVECSALGCQKSQQACQEFKLSRHVKKHDHQLTTNMMAGTNRKHH